MRRVDLHCYPGTDVWIASQGPYVSALGEYWGQAWVAKAEDQVVADVTAAGVEAVLVAFDIESLTGAPPCGNDYVAALRDRHPGVFIQAWGTVDPLKGSAAVAEAVAAVRDHHVLGFHFHPIMGHFAVDDPALNPLFETIAGLGVPVMVDVGTTGMGAGLPGGLGARLEHARRLAVDRRDDRGGAAQGQRVLGAVRLGAQVLPAVAARRHPGPAAREDHVRQRPPEPAVRAHPAGMG